MDKLSWKLIDKYFTDNPNNLVSHHLESYNDFFNKGINNIFRENNPIRIIEREEEGDTPDKRNECLLYLGGKDGSKIYFGKPIIYDENHIHYMYPNDARLRNMTYGITVHYDVEVDFIYYVDGERIETPKTFETTSKVKSIESLAEEPKNLALIDSVPTTASFGITTNNFIDSFSYLIE